MFLHAEFWAEDGGSWYPEAYEFGWRCLLWPVSGYLQTISRLGALASQMLPLSWAPTFFALAALTIQVAPTIFLVSDRMNGSWPSRRGRMLFAAVFLTLQNSGEVYANLTNAQWYLALLAFLVATGDLPASWRGRVFDAAVLVGSGLSGPFCLFLLPIAAWAALRPGCHGRTGRVFLVLATVAVQGTFIVLTAGPDRLPQNLGASIPLLVRIVALQVAVGALMGQHTIAWLIAWTPWYYGRLLPSGVALAWLVLTAVAVWRGTTLLRQATLFSWLVFAAALWHPNISPVTPQWQGMVWPGMGVRYYIFPMIAFLGAVFTFASDRVPALRAVGLALLLLLVANIPFDWRPNQLWPPERSWEVTDFDEQAQQFDFATPGTEFSFGTHPNGRRMLLVKH